MKHGGDIRQHRKLSGELCRNNKVVLIGCFSPCTDLAIAGARHFESKAMNDAMFWAKAMELYYIAVDLAMFYDLPYFCENPMSMISTINRKPDFKFNPCDFGKYLPKEHKHCLYSDIYPGRDAYNKTTWIWYGNGFIPPVKKPIEPVSKDYPGWKKLGGKSERTNERTKQIRSVTPEGFSLALFKSNN